MSVESSSKTWREQGSALQKRLKMAAPLAAVAVALPGCGGNDQSQAPKPTRQEALTAKYHPEQLQKTGREAFNWLIHLSTGGLHTRPAHGPRAADREKVNATNIQTELAIASAALLGTGVDYGNRINEYALAHELIPKPVQERLTAAGFQFKPVRAVDCLVTGYFNPYDYSNHPPDELAIKTHPEGDSWRVTIPLPAGQLPNNPLEHGPLSDRALHVGIFEPIDWILASTSACRDEPEIGSLDDQGVPRLKQIY